MAHFLLRLFVKNADQTSDPKVRAAVGTLSGIVGILPFPRESHYRHPVRLRFHHC